MPWSGFSTLDGVNPNKKKKKKKKERENKIFQTDAKKFYREIGENQVMVKETPPKDNMEKF